MLPLAVELLRLLEESCATMHLGMLRSLCRWAAAPFLGSIWLTSKELSIEKLSNISLYDSPQHSLLWGSPAIVEEQLVPKKANLPTNLWRALQLPPSVVTQEH